MGSLANDAKYRVVPNLPCPTCFQGFVECVVKIPHGFDKKPELVYAACDPYDCTFDRAGREKLLSRAMEYVEEYERDKEERRKR